MKAVLVSAPLLAMKDVGEFYVYPPLGPLLLATIARQAGHDVTVCDLNVARARGDLAASDDVHQAAADYILALEADLIGFGSLSSTFAATILIAKAVKTRRPSQPVVFGGPQATIVCDELLRDVREVDFVLAGEADYTFTQFLDELSGHQPMSTAGLARRSNGRVIRQPPGPVVDLEGLPMIDYALWPLREAVDQGWYQDDAVPVDAGRGCPYRCSFCSTSTHFRRRYRLKSPRRICREITALHDEYGFSRFTMSHDSLTADRAGAIALAKAIAACEIPALEWMCSARVDTVDPELLSILKDSGCVRLYFGVETASARMQAAIDKDLDVDQIEPTLVRAHDLGFTLTISCIVGFPQEQWEDVEATLRLLLRWSGLGEVNTQLHLLAPQNGTALFEEYGHCLQFDHWHSDFAFFNATSPGSELAFAKDHPGLCPQWHFMPNDRVDRRTLTELREFMELLMVMLPGVGPFIVHTEPSVVDLVARWAARTRDSGLRPPSETDFFAYLSEDNVPYGRTLLEVLRENPRLTDAQRSVLQLWDAMADLVESPQVDGAADAPTADADLMATRRADEILPALTRRAAVAVLSHRAHQALDEWKRHGRWRWPDRGDLRLLLVADDAEAEDVQMHEVSPLIAALVALCDGRHTIADLYHFVHQFAGDETARLRQSMGTGELLGRALGTLRETVGLRLNVADPSTE